MGLSQHEMLNGRHVPSDVPGPRSTGLLWRQERRCFNAGVFLRHRAIAVVGAVGDSVCDVDGDVFIDLFQGAGRLPLGHSHLKLVETMIEGLGWLAGGVELPAPRHDPFTDALPPSGHGRIRMHLYARAGANVVDAVLRLRQTVGGPGDVVRLRAGFPGGTHARMIFGRLAPASTPAVDRSTRTLIPNDVPGVYFGPHSVFSRSPVRFGPETCASYGYYLKRSLWDTSVGLSLYFVRWGSALTALEFFWIVEKVQTDCGGTGRGLALEQYDTEPPVIITSQALSGIGAPVTITRLDVWVSGPHTETFRGDQLTPAAGAELSGSPIGVMCWAASARAVSRSPGHSLGSVTHHRRAGNVAALSRGALCDLASDPVGNARGSLCSSGVRRLHRFFEVTCDRVRDKIAVEDGDRRVTYRELDQQANQLAHFLRGLGIGPGVRVGILLHRSSQTYVSLLAVLKAGAAFVPIDPGAPRDRVGYIAEDSGLDLLITSSDFAAVTVDLGCPLLELDGFAAALGAYPVSRLVADEDGDPPCYVIYTSGSSGRPKGVEIAQSSICNFIGVVPSVYDVRKTDRVYQGMTIAFDFSIEEIWPTFAVGATLVVGPTDSRRLGSELGDFLDESGVTVFYCVPTLLATVSRDLPTVRSLIVGGEACPAELVERWSSPGRRILNTYGPTEATVTATCGELRAGRPVTIGRALPTCEVILLDSDLQPVPAGDVGEICIGGPGVARGYLGRPDLTADRFVRHRLAPGGGRLYRTGDLGRLLDNGEFEYCGRADTQVKIRGYRVELTEIESVLAQTPGIAQTVVNTYQSEPGLVELIGYYSLSADTVSVDQQHVYQQLRERLPAYMVPAYLEQLTVIPMLPSGKADRNNLPAPKGPRSLATQHAYVGPATDTERILADALAHIMRVERVSVDSHFFDDLGANSLLMAHFCTLVRKRAGLLAMSMRTSICTPRSAPWPPLSRKQCPPPRRHGSRRPGKRRRAPVDCSTSCAEHSRFCCSSDTPTSLD